MLSIFGVLRLNLSKPVFIPLFLSLNSFQNFQQDLFVFFCLKLIFLRLVHARILALRYNLHVVKLKTEKSENTSAEKNKKGKLLKTGLKILVSSVLLYVIFSRIDKESFIQNISLMDLRLAPFIIGFIILNYIVSAFRWKQLLIYKETRQVKLPYLINLYFIGSFFNNFMPTSIGGDVFKMYQLGRKIGNAAKGLSATFMERFTGIIALVTISYFGLIRTLPFWVEMLPADAQANPLLVTLFKVVLFTGFWIAAVIGFFSLSILAKKISFFEKIYSALISYKNNTKPLFKAFLISFAVQLLSIFTQYFIFLSLGVELPLFYSFFVFPVITLAGFFVPSLNGLGVQDALYISFMGMVGVSESLALSASILYHLSRLLVSLIGGVLYALGKNE
ncbi:flippase-like domain-containing protein [candidate division WWE3 bacterium]|nr:flippase-like domain-containing protein [candidate division WWE3 bacterium]